jgi:glycosyltransferase involved in cell wall biosynthesis|tara:strand:+ start:5175 stop:6554 length:1380 start_codon:yes stop_codon:yes gene_type:complete
MTKSNPLVTVYITNCNYGSFIQEAINSVLEQTYQHIELVIVDDGSTDNSKDIIDQYSSLDNVTAIFQSNQGLAKTNNVAISVAKGTYIVRLDADDKFHNDAIMHLLSGFDSEDVAMVFGNWNVVNEEGTFLYSYKRHNFQKDVTLLDSPAHGACTMFRTDYLQLVGGYDEDLLCQDGYELWFRIIDKFVVKNIDAIIFDYRRHGDNLTGNEDNILSTRAVILRKVAKEKGLQKKSTFCFIPIRGSNVDSRSRPFQRLGGKYLIDHVLEEIIASGVFSAVVVSTPDQTLIEYLNETYAHEITVQSRARDLSRINTSIDQVILDLFAGEASYLKSYDYGMLIGIDRPFNKPHLLQSAIDIASIFGVSNVIGVRPNSDIFFNHNGSSLEGVNFSKDSLRLERNDLYEMVRGFNLFNVKNLLSNESMWGDIIGHVVLDQKTAICIDSKLDLLIAEALLDSHYK